MPTILVVDDDPDYARLVHRWLQGAGYDVELAVSALGISARLLIEPRVDGVVLDCMMPALTGTTVLQLLSRHHRLKDIPVLLMSGSSVGDLQLAARDHGRALFLEKTGRRQPLLDALGVLLQMPPTPSLLMPPPWAAGKSP